MTQDIHRLSLMRRRPVTECLTIDKLRDRFTASQRARNLSPQTIQHYAYSFKDFDSFLLDTGRPGTVESLDSESLRAFSQWLIDTPTRTWRNSTVRSMSSVHGHLRDLSAFTRWLEDEALIDRAPKL
ncbi:hypothetical protein BH24CHL4_BH24CHL4_09740 [soil metagenome]